MTKEEAMCWLHNPEDEKCYNAYEVEAYDMAIKALEQEPYKDAISRQAVIDGIKKYFHDEYYQRISIQDCMDCFIEDVIKDMSPVVPQPKTGHWIQISPQGIYECSKCGQNVMTGDICAYKFCNGCGCRMVDKEEIDK